MTKAFDIAQIYPIQSIENDCLINGNGDLTFGFSVLLTEAYMLSPEKADTIHAAFVSLLKFLPPGSVFQQVNYYYVNEYRPQNIEGEIFLKQNHERFLSGRKKLNHYCDLYFTVSDNQKVMGNPTHNSFIKMFNYVFNKKVKDIEKLVLKYQSLVTRVTSSLESIPNIKILRLKNETLKLKQFQFMSMSYEKNYDTEASYICPPIQNDKGSFKIGDKHIKVISMTNGIDHLENLKINKTIKKEQFHKLIDKSEDVPLLSSLTFPIGLGFVSNHIQILTIEILDNEKTKSHLSKLNSENKLFIMIPPMSEAAQNKADDIANFKKELADNDSICAKYAVTVILDNSNIDKLEHDQNMMLDSFSKIGAGAYVENLEAANLFMACLPGNAKANYRTNLNIGTIGRALMYLTKESMMVSDPKGFTFVDRFGNPVVVDFWWEPKRKKIITARNRAVFAATGTGKSYLLNSMIYQEVMMGFHDIVIDIGFSYKKLVNIFDGLHFDASNKDLLSFDLFDFTKDSKGKYLIGTGTENSEDANDKINFIYTILVKIWKKTIPITNEESTILKQLISNFYKYVNENSIRPNLISFSKFIEIFKDSKDSAEWAKYFDYESLILCLSPYVNGEYKKLFNAEKNIELMDKKLIVFDLEPIKNNKEIMSLVIVVIVELVLNKIKKLPMDTPKGIYLDEAFDFIAGDSEIADFIAYLYRTIRKKEGAITLATQSSTFLEACSKSVRDSIIVNTSVKILLDHSDDQGSFPGLQANWSLSPYDIDILKTVKKANYEFFVKMGEQTNVYRLLESSKNFAVFNSDADHNKLIYELFNKHGNMQAAIEDYNFNYLK